MNLSELPEALTVMQAQIRELQEIVSRLNAAPIIVGRASFMDIIADVVSKHYRITRKEMMSTSKTSAIVWPRMLTMHLIRQRSRYTLCEIGKFFYRDHGTVLSACRRIVERMTTEPHYRNEVEYLTTCIEKVLHEEKEIKKSHQAET